MEFKTRIISSGTPGRGRTRDWGKSFWYVKIKSIKLLNIWSIYSCFQYVGALLGLGGVGYMAKNFKNKPKDMKLSVYLIHTRLLAQGTVIGKILCYVLTRIFEKSIKYFRRSDFGYDSSYVWTDVKKV